MSSESSVLRGLRRPEHTGENRCLPCTVVNLVLAVAASLLASLVALPLAVAVLAVSLAAIYLRGYLVPGTPALTKRYLPDRVLAYFEHGDPTSAASDPAADEEWETFEKLEYRRENEVDPEAFLSEAGAVRTAADSAEPDLVFTDAFREAVDDRLSTIGSEGVDDESLAGLLDASPGDVRRVEADHPAIEVGNRIRRWPSRAALLADVATNESLAAATDDWLDVPLEQRLEVLESLRTFRETCPACGGPVVGNESVVESCCRNVDVVTIVCDDCDARLLELPAHAADDVTARGGTLA